MLMEANLSTDTKANNSETCLSTGLVISDEIDGWDPAHASLEFIGG